MPGRTAKKSTKRAGPASAAAPGAQAGKSNGDRIAELESLNTKLEAELATARARIAELETARDQTIDRIAWVIDSLHNLTEK